MKRIIFAFTLMASFCYGQDGLPNKRSVLTLDEGVYVHRSGTQYFPLGKTYMEIYEVISDSLVRRFGMEFRSSDSTFVRKVPMEGCTRKVYDQMKSDVDFVIHNQEELRKETIEFINTYRTSYEVWYYFKCLGILGK